MQTIAITTIRFANSLKAVELPFLRGAMIEAASLHDASLFHNHTDEGFRYAYPLIQYKILQGRAALVGVNQGANDLLWLRPYLSREHHIGFKNILFEIMSIENAEAQIGVSSHTMRYRLNNWLPLNQKNDRLFHSTKDESKRLMLLEGILTNNIVAFFQAFDYSPSEHIFCSIERRGPIEKVMYKDVQMRAVDVDFITNALLPLNIGIGKGTSLGHGIIQTI